MKRSKGALPVSIGAQELVGSGYRTHEGYDPTESAQQVQVEGVADLLFVCADHALKFKKNQPNQGCAGSSPKLEPDSS